MRRLNALALLLPVLLISGCGGSSAPTPPAPGPGTGTPAPTPTPGSSTLPAGAVSAFADGTAQSGIVHGFGFTAGLNDMVAQFAGGAASGDVDGDGLPDLVVLRGDDGPNLLYINRGGGGRWNGEQGLMRGRARVCMALG